MSDTTFYYVIGALAIILGVLLFNSFKEKRYRDEVRRQFGHSDQDALLDSQREQVRDGQGVLNHNMRRQPATKAPKADVFEIEMNDEQVAPVAESLYDSTQSAVAKEQAKTHLAARADSDEASYFVNQNQMSTGNEPIPAVNATDTPSHATKSIKDLNIPNVKSVLAANKTSSGLLLDLQDLTQVDLPWFDSRIDYLAYVSLRQPMELHTIPRLSNKHRFRVAACTMDGRFQLAEPIPSVYYQGFVVGLQCISRKGLAVRDDLMQFSEQMRQFTAQLGGAVAVANVDAFLEVAAPMDELCARVDQTIAIHLVSRESIAGREIKAALEQLRFELDAGVFWYKDHQGKNLFNAVNLDSSPFITTALDEHQYRGFSMLYDLTKVPAGEKTFNQFMDLVVKLSSSLGLDLVDDQLNELSTQWLKDIRAYVVERQQEMISVDIEPGSELAERLFS